jgi:Transglutaminase-like superfamily
MKKNIGFVILICLLAGQLQAQNAVKNLAKQITAGKANDSLKVRAIYEWVAKNIDYDLELLAAIRQKSAEEFQELQEPSKVLKNKKAVCMGYSTLFKELCMAEGIKAEVISGNSKQYYATTKKHVIGDVLHAWNSVKINKKWYLLDATWSAGAVDESYSKFIRRFDDKYYLTEGLEFVKTHLPSDPMWQLLDEPISLKEFKLYNELPVSRTNPAKFQYADTLKTYESMDSTAQKIGMYRRAMRFDPANDDAKLGIGLFYGKLAIAKMNQLNGMNNKVSGKIETAEQARKIIGLKPEFDKLYKESETLFQSARYYFIQVPKNSTFYRTADFNANSMKSTIQQLAANKASMATFFKSLEDFVRKVEKK